MLQEMLFQMWENIVLALTILFHAFMLTISSNAMYESLKEMVEDFRDENWDAFWASVMLFIFAVIWFSLSCRYFIIFLRGAING